MRRLLLLASFAGLAACGGGGGGTPTPPVKPTATPTPFTAVHITFPTTPLAVAKQSGTGAWQSATPAPVMEIDLPLSTRAFGLAYVCPQGNQNQEFILQATIADAASFTAPCPAATPAEATANITDSYDVSAVPGATGMALYEKGWMLGILGGSTGNYSAPGVAGTADIVALATAGNNVVGAKILRGQSVTNNAVINIPPMAASDASTTQPINLPSLLMSFVPFVSLNYVTAGGTGAQLSNPSTMATYGTIPASESEAGDYYELNYSQIRVADIGRETVAIKQTFTTPGPVSIVMPRGPRFYSVGAAPLPTFTFDNASLSITGNTVDVATLSWTGTGVSAYVTSAWLATANIYTLPDLTSLTGFFATPPANTPVNWSQSANMVNASPFALIGASQPVGTTLQTVGVSGHFTEP